MENARSKNITDKDGDTHIYVPAGRFYVFSGVLFLGSLVLTGSWIGLYINIPKTFASFWSKECLIYLGLIVLVLFFIGNEFKTSRKNSRIPQMLIGKEEVSFKRNGKGGPLLISDYVTLKYKDIISASYPSEHDFTKTLTFMTATQLYSVGLVLENEERMMVYEIIKSKLQSYLNIRNQEATIF
ncbi:hypothetical protein ACEN2P_00795 [Pedobacter psychrotolerans]|uniref:hypothetical protein n=1 Tax=Pedobacter psychrotolerans TaxID=1843235 RepID=UPI003F99C8CA